MSVLKIVRGRQKSAVRAIIHGVEGIGKSTLAVSELIVQPQGFETVVIDSADWAEKLLIEWMLQQTNKKSIEDFGFGKGYVMLQEHVTRFLASCDSLVQAGLHVVFVAHTTVKRTSPPDHTDGFDRYELKLTKQVAPLLREWCDLMLFCNYKTKLVEGNDGRMKATGGKQRVMHAERSAAWDAKNRFGLPEEMPMQFEQLASIFDAPSAKPTWMQRVEAAETLDQLGRIADEADEAKSRGELTEAQLEKLRGMIDRRDKQLQEAVHVE